MMLQEIAVLLIVGCAVGYLGWKILLSRPRRSKGPDVPLSRLRHKKDGVPGCHG